MANNWHSADLGRFFPNEMRKAADAVSDLNDQIAQGLAIVKSALEFAAAVAAVASADPLELALREAIAQIEEFIDGILEGTTAHALMVPIQKQFYGIGDPIPPTDKDPTSLTPSFDQLAEDGGYPQRVIQDITPETISFVNNSTTALGGNAGYWRVVALSLQDEGDFAKPIFPANFAVAGTAVIFGSESLTGLYRIIAILNKLLHMGLRADMSSRSQPRANNLTARIMPIPTEGRIGVQLDWTPVPPLLIKPLFSSEKAIITEIFVIRSTNPLLRERFAWGNVFPAEPGDSDLPETLDTKVIARLRNDGFIARYVDTDSTLEISKPYYYTLSVRYRIGDVFQPMSQFSNTVRVFYDGIPHTTRLSVPPDWFATPSLVQLFPPLQSLSSKIKLYVEGLLTRTVSNNGIADLIKQTVTQIGLLLDQANAVAADLNAIEDLLRSLAAENGTGIYTTNIEVASGGMSAWMGQLATRLSDPADPTRPPFDNGELTAGFVIVAGAPNLPRLAKFRALLALLFGKGSDNPYKQAVDSLPDPLPLASTGATTTFADNMQPVTAATAGGAPAVTLAPGRKIVFDASMTPSTTLDDC